MNLNEAAILKPSATLTLSPRNILGNVDLLGPRLGNRKKASPRWNRYQGTGHCMACLQAQKMWAQQ